MEAGDQRNSLIPIIFIRSRAAPSIPAARETPAVAGLPAPESGRQMPRGNCAASPHDYICAGS